MDAKIRLYYIDNDQVALHYVNVMANETEEPLTLHNGSQTRLLSIIKPIMKPIN